MKDGRAKERGERRLFMFGLGLDEGPMLRHTLCPPARAALLCSARDFPDLVFEEPSLAPSCAVGHASTVAE